MALKLFSNFSLRSARLYFISSTIFTTFFLGVAVAEYSIGGKPSLLGTIWHLDSIYGNKVPEIFKMNMHVNTNSLRGGAGCHKYLANFKRNGHTDFIITSINKTKKGCNIPNKSAKSVNIRSWENSYFKTLKRVTSVRQATNSKLHFLNRNGEIAMQFHKIGYQNVVDLKKTSIGKSKALSKEQILANEKADREANAKAIVIMGGILGVFAEGAKVVIDSAKEASNSSSYTPPSRPLEKPNHTSNKPSNINYKCNFICYSYGSGLSKKFSSEQYLSINANSKSSAESKSYSEANEACKNMGYFETHSRWGKGSTSCRLF